MAKKVSDMRIPELVKLIHHILDPAWRLADRDNSAISKLGFLIEKLLEKAYEEGVDDGASNPYA